MIRAALCILAVAASPSYTFNDDPVAPTVCVATVHDEFGHEHELQGVELQSPVRQ